MNRWLFFPSSSAFSFGDCLDFDGTDDFVTFGGSNILTDPSSAWTIGLWFNADVVSGFPTLFRLKSGVANNPFGVILSDNASYADLSFGSNTTFYRGKISFSLTATTWYHLMVVYNGSGATSSANFTIYINGVSMSKTAAGAFGVATDENILGAISSGASFHYNGRQDEFAFWQSALNPTQVANQYNSGNGNFADADVNPLVWFKFNGDALNSGSGGAAYNATLNNFVANPYVPHV